MEPSLNTTETLRLLCCSCFPTCRLSSPTLEADAAQEGEDRDWIRGSMNYPIRGAAVNGRNRTTWTEQQHGDDEEQDRRESDLLSLHETSSSTPVRRRRIVGGDISGSGISWGSGLSRWTLLKSWWRGDGKGRIRLSDDEDDDDQEGIREEEGNGTFLEGEGDRDAVLITDNVLVAPVDPPLSPSRSDRTNAGMQETAEERELRRERRRAKRRAKELGLSVREFDQGVIAEPEELDSANLIDIEVTPKSTRRPRHQQSSSYSSSTDSGLHLPPDYRAHSQRFDQTEDESRLSVVGEHGNDSFEQDELERQSRKEARRLRRAARSNAAPSSSNGSDSSRSNLASSAATTPILEHHSQAQFLPASYTESKRPRHRSNPSTSTTSTSSSGKQRRPRKQVHLAPSPLEEEPQPGTYYLAEDGQYYLTRSDEQQMYYQDEDGQLRALPNQELGEGGFVLEEETTAYDHVGLIPAKAIGQQEDEENL